MEEWYFEVKVDTNPLLVRGKETKKKKKRKREKEKTGSLRELSNAARRSQVH